MNLIQTTLGRIAVGAVLPLAVVAGVVSAPVVNAATPAASPAIAPASVNAAINAAAVTVATAAAPAIVRAAPDPTYKLADVAKHATQSDCWSAINSSVYNLTAFISSHEGGSRVIVALCGTDGTTMYRGQHGTSTSSDPARTLANYRIGVYDSTPPPVPSTTYTFAQVQTHKTAADCWTVVGTTVYNLSAFVNIHPGGTTQIVALCGIDGTAGFTGKHSASSSAKSTLAQYSIGSLSGGTPPPAPTPSTVFTQTMLTAHNKQTDCYSAINGIVYDLTSFINTHPGGTAPIIALCGIDGSVSYNTKHGSSSAAPSALAQSTLAQLPKMGTFNAAVVSTAGTYTLAQVKTHNTQADCWSAVLGNVYNLTAWIPQHPGGASQIVAMCGTEGSIAFWGKHSGSSTAQAALAAYKIGTQSDYVPVTLPAAPTVAAITVHGDYTMDEVAKHNTASDCWAVIGGSIYGLSTWIPIHPGGAGVITPMCGQDGTAAYNGKHGGSASAGAILAKVRIGSLVGAKAVVLVDYTIADVAMHKTAGDCWSAVNGGVYDLTKWVAQHPGGPAVIEAMCGIDGSAAFNAKHGGSAGAATALATFKIGNLVAGTAAATAGTVQAAKVFTKAQVRRHHFTKHCWTSANKNVYNLSRYTAKHPGKRAFIRAVCGKDSTRIWNARTGGPSRTLKKLKPFWVGTLVSAVPAASPAAPAAPAAAPAPAPVPGSTTKYTAAQVGAHATTTDCWSIVSGGVYNLTSWIGVHPGGAGVIKAMCGKDGTSSFNSMHSGSATAKAALAKMQIGIVG
jgi:cytochrome b involved in lipid metabolism